MLSTLLLAAAATTTAPAPPHALSAALVGCLCVGSNEHYETGLLRSERATTLGVRAQYDYSLDSGFFIGLMAGFESVQRRDGIQPNASVFLVGPTLGTRWGDRIRGGVRLAAGPGYAYDPRWKAHEPSNVHVTGFFVDASAELSVPVGGTTELFLDFSILSVRSFAYGEGPYGLQRWWYAGSAVLPITAMGAAGVRTSF